MKLIVDADTDKVLGAAMVGPDAPEIIQVRSHVHVLHQSFLKEIWRLQGVHMSVCNAR